MNKGKQRRMEQLPEQMPEVQADAVTSEHPQRKPDTASNTSAEGSAVTSAHRPPRKQKNEALLLKHYRLRATDVKQTEAVARQRGSDLGDLVRKQYERGVNVDTALGAPGEDGLYGLYQGSRLAELLRADIDGLISFALNHGVVPTILQEYRRMIGSLNEAIQHGRTATAASSLAPEDTPSLGNRGNHQPQQFPSIPATEVADEADGVLGMFFGGPEDSDESR
jgi:hypothetical protein